MLAPTSATIVRRPVLGLFRGAALILAVHGDRRMRGAMLAGPPVDRVVRGLGRQGDEDVVEGGDRRPGVALFARGPERPQRLQLLLGKPSGDGQRPRSLPGIHAPPGCPQTAGADAPQAPPRPSSYVLTPDDGPGFPVVTMAREKRTFRDITCETGTWVAHKTPWTPM